MSDRDGLAAEYVIGTLPLPDRMAAERLIASDSDFAALVEAWQVRLSPLDDEYGDIAAPTHLLPKIEARLFPVAERRRVRWRLPFLGSVAAALALALVLVNWPDRHPALTTAELTGAGQSLIVAASFDPAAKMLTLRRSAGPAADTGKDYELWVIPAGQKPVSLGVLRDDPVTVPLAALVAGTTLAVTLETKGGSPTGAAQGPLLVASVIGS
jgi:anti-sigma-K factor RskA